MWLVNNKKKILIYCVMIENIGYVHFVGWSIYYIFLKWFVKLFVFEDRVKVGDSDRTDRTTSYKTSNLTICQVRNVFYNISMWSYKTVSNGVNDDGQQANGLNPILHVSYVPYKKSHQSLLQVNLSSLYTQYRINLQLTWAESKSSWSTKHFLCIVSFLYGVIYPTLQSKLCLLNEIW